LSHFKKLEHMWQRRGRMPQLGYGIPETLFNILETRVWTKSASILTEEISRLKGLKRSTVPLKERVHGKILGTRGQASSTRWVSRPYLPHA
jgi:hypothetical protein